MLKIRFSLKLTALVVLIAALMGTSLVYAGGWVVITLDKLPEQVIAGQPYTLGLMARQHGRTPLQAGELRISARQVDSGQQVSFTASPQGQPGHYQAELVFPEPGQWEWGVASGLYPELQPMPVLEVTAAASAAVPGSREAGDASPLAMSAPAAAVGGLAVLALAAGLMLILRSRSRRLYLLAGVGMLIVCGALVFGLFSRANAEARQAPVAIQSAASKTVGQQLFLAKGCVVCHVNDRALENSAQFGVSSGPNLTAYHNDPEFLQAWLKDPQAVRAGTQMPNLALEPSEIDALIKFINDQE